MNKANLVVSACTQAKSGNGFNLILKGKTKIEDAFGTQEIDSTELASVR